ncbi:DNA-binding transcriptional regulator, LysR family [Evansella caseinilytica]|uniref:DNA-binding transcriptional regulator, LysR family n=1 Tax=Evansella caseinilytica TaxID=1503961 RepID=A0A1H3H5E8_9BACI|nr:LysR family transcriptional regulator [Evansella caseinilytica]SDY10742.1 DNA-binding transcriptional regulator, LysR family [Evansella caseinilytica]
MNTEALEYFIKVYEKKSVTAAAKDLFITPQGISKTIKQLEMELETELFSRGPRGMKATESGELLYARAKHISYLMKDIKKEIDIINGKKGTLNVVVTYSPSLAISSYFIFQFMELYPDIQMKLREFPDEYSVGKLFEEEADVGIVIGNEGIENCECEMIAAGEVVAVVSRQHRLAEKEEISIIELENESLVLKSVGEGKEHGLVDKCLEYGFTPAVKHEFGSIITAHHLCKMSGYVAVSIDFVEEALKDDELKIIRLKEKIPQNIYLITRKSVHQSKAVSLFQQYIKEYCEQ